MRVMMSGGGTAGHVYPALTVAGLLRAGGRDEVRFIGTPASIEARLVPEAGISFTALRARGYDRSRPLSLITSSAVLLASTVRAVGLIRSERPDVVAGFGGYVSIPVGLAAVLTRTPLVLHEQNSVPGLANKLLSRWAATVGVTYTESAGYLKHPDRAVVTGNPVRESVLAADREASRDAMGIAPREVLLLVFGGSRGARHINTRIAAMADALLSIEDVVVLHVSGKGESEAVRQAVTGLGESATQRYRIAEYLDDMGSALAACDLALARAGATSIAELTAVGRGSVLVPYPYATDDHQTLNAKSVVAAGGAVMFSDAEIDGDEFADTVTTLLTDASRRATMAAASADLSRPDAAARVGALLREAAADNAPYKEVS